VQGALHEKLRYGNAAVISLFFGVFRGQPLIGWFLGTQFSKYVTPIDHWIAFVLLAYIGGKMIWEAAHGGPRRQLPDG
jgi:putative Mn2+ efflux pump MntP